MRKRHKPLGMGGSARRGKRASWLDVPALYLWFAGIRYPICWFAGEQRRTNRYNGVDSLIVGKRAP